MTATARVGVGKTAAGQTWDTGETRCCCLLLRSDVPQKKTHTPVEEHALSVEITSVLVGQDDLKLSYQGFSFFRAKLRHCTQSQGWAPTVNSTCTNSGYGIPTRNTSMDVDQLIQSLPACLCITHSPHHRLVSCGKARLT